MNSGSDNFNRYVITGGVIAAIVLAVTSFFLHYSYKQEFYDTVKAKANKYSHTYMHRVFKRDSLQLARYRGNYVVLAFWSDATGPSEAMLHRLAGLKHQYGEKMQVIAASVRLDSAHVVSFNDRTHYPFEYVYGTDIFRDMNVPGIPCFIVFDPDDSVVYVHAGYRNDSAMEPVQKLISERYGLQPVSGKMVETRLLYG